MALDLSNTFAGKINPPDSEYPYGSFRNITTPKDGTGTPLLASWPNDFYGFLQAILTEAGITPNGTSDNVTESQYLQGLKQICGEAAPTAGVTLRIPSDHPDLQTALDVAYAMYRPGGGDVTIQFEAGYQPTSGAFVKNGDYGHIKIESADTELTLNAGFSPEASILDVRNARAPRWNVLVNANNRSNGLYYIQAASGVVAPGCGVKNAYFSGLSVLRGSSVYARSTTFTGCGGLGDAAGIFVSSSIADVEAADCSSSKTGLQAFDASIVEADSVIANNCTDYGLHAVCSVVKADSGQFNSAGSQGVLAVKASTISADACSATGCGVSAITASESSRVTARGSSGLTGGGNFGVTCQSGSSLDVSGSNCRKSAGTDSVDDIVISGGSHTRAFSSIGGLSETKNTLTPQGIIYQV